MKKLIFFVIILITFCTPLRVLAQNANWVTLESDISAITAVGQTINVTLNGSINTPITGAALSLLYDPTCFKIASHQTGSLLPGAVSFVQTHANQLDLTYYFQGGGLSQTGAGSLMSIQLETIKLCTGDISVAPESVLLGVLDAKGLASNLPNVEQRTLSLRLTADQIPAATATTPPPAAVATETGGVGGPDNTYIFALLLIMLPVVGAIGYFVFKISTRQPETTSPIFGNLPKRKTPALIYNGQSMSISPKGITLGRYVQIIKQDGCFYLRDTGSRHGTFLNGHPLGADNYLLRDGDDIQLGHNVSYRFVESSGQTIKSADLKWLKQR